jgi:hypothetical protein
MAEPPGLEPYPDQTVWLSDSWVTHVPGGEPVPTPEHALAPVNGFNKRHDKRCYAAMMRLPVTRAA